MTRKRSKLIRFLALLLVLAGMLQLPMVAQAAELAAADAAGTDIPDKMLDNFLLDALEYTGYKVSWLRDNGYLYQHDWYGGRLLGKTTGSGQQILSNIGYGGSVQGVDTVTEKAPMATP